MYSVPVPQLINSRAPGRLPTAPTTCGNYDFELKPFSNKLREPLELQHLVTKHPVGGNPLKIDPLAANY